MRSYDQLYIDGAWVKPAGNGDARGHRRDDGSGVRHDPGRYAGRYRPRGRRGQGRLRNLVGRVGSRARQAPATRRRGARSAPGRDRRRDHARGRDAEGSVGRDPGRHGHLRVLDRSGACVDLRVRRRQRGSRRPRAGRRRRLHHALELSAQPDRREGRVRAGCRLHRRAEAVGGRAGQRVHARGDHPRRRLPGRCLQSRLRRRPGRGRGLGLASRCRHDLVHRIDACRASAWPSSRRSRSSGSRWSSAASLRTCFSTMPISRPR